MSINYAYGYVRVSTDKQDELSPDSQEKLLRDYAHKNSIVILKIFWEIGISGRKADKRPAFQEMIAAAKSTEHPVDAILVWKYSRFARNQEESIVYKSLLQKKHNVSVISVSEPIIEGPFGSLIERIIEWMDEYYSIRLSGEVARGMKEKALRGGYQARPPLGYEIIQRGEPPVIVAEEANIVQIIFDKYVYEKIGIFDIARYLNTLGYTTSHGKAFERRSIEYILQNPTYCGMIRWNRTTNETNEIKPKDEWIVTAGTHEPIISKELFEKAQLRYTSEYKPRGRRPSSTYSHWLSGVMKCPSCGRTMIAKHITDPHSGRDYSYFCCYGYTKGKCLAKTSVSSVKLEPAVLESIHKVLKSRALTFQYVAPETKIDTNESQLLQELLKKTEAKEVRIKEAYRNGIDNLEEYGYNKKIIQKEKEDIVKRLNEFNAKDNEVDHTPEMLGRLHNVYEILVAGNVPIQVKNEVLKSVIDKIVYERETDTLNVYYYYKP